MFEEDEDESEVPSVPIRGRRPKFSGLIWPVNNLYKCLVF